MTQYHEAKDDENKLPSIHNKIQKLEDKSWYGTALLIIVSALILISTLMNAIMGFEESTPIVFVNGLLVIIHMVLVYLSKSEKLMAYVGGLLVFLVCLVLNHLLVGWILIGGWKLSLIIIMCYLVFISESYKLKKLNRELNH